MLDYTLLKKTLKELKPNEYKVFMFISLEYEYAIVNGGDCCILSFADIRKGTGIKKNDTIISCVRTLVNRQLITHKTEYVAGKQKSKSVFTSVLSSPKNGLITSDSSPNNGLNSSPKNGLRVVQKMDSNTKEGPMKDKKSVIGPDITKVNEFAKWDAQHSYYTFQWELFKKCVDGCWTTEGLIGIQDKATEAIRLSYKENFQRDKLEIVKKTLQEQNLKIPVRKTNVDECYRLPDNFLDNNDLKQI